MRIKGLDTIRFFCAIIVVMSHFSFILITKEFASTNILLSGLRAIYGNMFTGIAAVIIFFIISGFCIHYPYINGKPMKVVQFLLQRITRIGIPAAIALLFFHLYFNVEMQVLWSLICEVIYYILYPLILIVIKRGGLIKILIITFIISIAWTVTFAVLNGDEDGNFHRSGFLSTWIIGLPIWLLGVLLAEKFSKNELPTHPFMVNHINIFRILLWGMAILTSVLKVHYGISFAYTMLLFSFPAYFWLAAEIKYSSIRKENNVGAFGGKLSYSIYLVHQAIALILTQKYKLDLLHSFWAFAIAIISTLVFSYIYYLAVEKPAHLLAKSIKLNI